MTRDAFAARWAAALGPGRWRPDAPLAPLTTFRVGGAADWLADVTSQEELARILVDARAVDVPVSVLGGGSNVLVADAGVRGLVVRLRLVTIDQPDACSVRAGAGATINGLVRWTIARGLAGVEAWAGTPGTVGGAVYGNAHWGGQNISEHIRVVRLMTYDGRSCDVPAAEMGFAYDTSRLQQSREVVVSATFAVRPGDVDGLRERARASLHYRKSTQPLARPSAGCIFQNPAPSDSLPDQIPRSAGALVDLAGLKGAVQGGARISDRHANFIVNDGEATAEDIRILIERARTAVRDRFGVALRDEIVYLGTFRHG